MWSQTLTAHSTIARARPIRKPPQVRTESSVGPNQHKFHVKTTSCLRLRQSQIKVSVATAFFTLLLG